jgi:cyanophycinase
MTGGNQLKLSGAISGTPFGEAIRSAHQSGTVIAGTSAGASIQSSHMVAFGRGGATAKQRMTQVAAGLGLVRDCVIDQHFDQRNRYGRLLMIVAQSPQLLGIGVDEDTCALVTTADDGSQRLEVLGRGSVTILDPSHIVTDAHEAPRSRPLLASGVVLHALPAGSVFDLGSRRLVVSATDTDAGVGAETKAGASLDLRRIVRDIAAADTSPTALRRRLARRSKGDH